MKKQYELRPLNTEGKVSVGIPRERLYIPLFVDNRDQILMNLQKVGRSAGLYQHESHRVDRNRDHIVEQFLSLPSKPEWLQMLDTDMDHPKDTPIRLTKWGKPIIGGLYFSRSPSRDPFVFRQVPNGKDKYGRECFLWSPMREEVFQFLEQNNVPYMDGAITIDGSQISPLVECDAIATGSMCIHRSVLEFMDKPLFEYRAGGQSEDLVFCHEAKNDYGIPIFCDLSTISGHYIFNAIGQTQFRMVYQNRGLKLSGYTQNEITKLLAEFLGIAPELAREKLDKGTAHMAGDYWLSKFGKVPVSEEDVTAFYKDPYVGHLYLIELIHWNFTPSFNNIKSIFTVYRNAEILEIGSGIGTLAIQLAIQKNKVTAVEVNEVLADFMEFRIKKVEKEIQTEMAEIEIDRKEDWKNAPDGSFDAVVCVDTFEHIPENQLRQMLKDISRVLRPNGNLYYHANFGQQDLYPMHFDHSEMWDTWLIEAGLLPLSSTRAMKRDIL